MKTLKNGAAWMRADFHLHTNADKEFRHDKEEKTGVFAKKYAEKLQEAGIGVGLITNHNKLDYDEFKAIRKRAQKAEIFVLPGVELSVNDGARGIHCLIAFDVNWFKNQMNYAEQFLTIAFENIPNRENENTRCKFNLETLLKKLKEHKEDGRDSFVILAHVEDKNGFLEELEGGRIQQLAEMPLFQEFVLGIQKLRTGELQTKMTQWFNAAQCPAPALVEGSDCKCLAEVGRPHQQNGQDKRTYLKLGDPSFEAVKFALANHEIRLQQDSIPTPTHAHIQQISFIGGKLDGETIYLNADLNCLIGTPGAGKSSILETVRYLLDLEVGNNAADLNYKENVVHNMMGSGGKGITHVLSRNGTMYTVERTWGEAPVIKNDSGEEVNVSIKEHIISGLYFGQKDLSNITDNFNQSFLDKFIGSSLQEAREKIKKQEEVVREIIVELDSLQKTKDQAEDLKRRQAWLSEQIRLFDKYDIQEKLGRQERFESDLDQIERMEEESEKELEKLILAISHFLSRSEKLLGHKSKENKKEFDQAQEIVQSIRSHVNEVEQQTTKLKEQELGKLQKISEGLTKRYNEEKEAFAEVRRAISVEGELKADDYLQYKRERKKVKRQLKLLEEQLQEETKLRKKLKEALSELRSRREEEVKNYTQAIESINNEGSNVSIRFTPYGNKDEFADRLAAFFHGTSIRKDHYRSIANNYEDTIAIYQDLTNSDSELSSILSGGRQLLSFQTRFEEQKADLLTNGSPHHFELLYQDRPIRKYSVGERASALILFSLTMGDNDLIVIDQPEDDLNSQAIYQEVVETLLKSKHRTQFIFATHNPNIPVLGDCEQIFCCEYFDDKLHYECGGIDSKNNQQNIIKIMEGGPEAFQKRTEIYAGWRG